MDADDILTAFEALLVQVWAARMAASALADAESASSAEIAMLSALLGDAYLSGMVVATDARKAKEAPINRVHLH